MKMLFNDFSPSNQGLILEGLIVDPKFRRVINKARFFYVLQAANPMITVDDEHSLVGVDFGKVFDILISALFGVENEFPHGGDRDLVAAWVDEFLVSFDCVSGVLWSDGIVEVRLEAVYGDSNSWYFVAENSKDIGYVFCRFLVPNDKDQFFAILDNLDLGVWCESLKS